MAHTLDVFGMLDSMGPGQFKFWKRLYAIKPWGEEWEQAATVAAAAHNAGMIAAGRIKDEFCKVQEPGDFIPKPVKTKKAQREESPDQSQAILAAMYGPKV